MKLHSYTLTALIGARASERNQKVLSGEWPPVDPIQNWESGVWLSTTGAKEEENPNCANPA